MQIIANIEITICPKDCRYGMLKAVLMAFYTVLYAFIFERWKIFLKFLYISIVYIKYIRIFVENIKTKRYDNFRKQNKKLNN